MAASVLYFKGMSLDMRFRLTFSEICEDFPLDLTVTGAWPGVLKTISFESSSPK